MASSQKPYRRLPGTGYNYLIPGWAILLLFFVIGIFALLFRGRRVQLWQGEEHLLLVEWDGNREYYKRFNYPDIQAFVVQKTSEGKVASGVFGFFVVLLASFGLVTSDVAGKIVLLSLAGLFGLLLLINFLSGATCRVWVRTAVQTEALPSLSRVPRFRKMLARIRPAIAVAQGELSAEEIPNRLRQWVVSGGSAPAPAYVVDDPNVPPRMLS